MNFLQRYPHFAAFAATTIGITGALTAILHPARALLVGFDCGALVFLAMLFRIFQHEQADAMRARAMRNEPDHHTLTAIALLVVAVVLTAVWVELADVGGDKTSGIPMAAVSLAMAWLFANALFALHYAHLYYLKARSGAAGDLGGLQFPGPGDHPDYWDFAYFAFVLGMTFQVSDVQVTSGRMRKLALFHGMLAFLYNIAVIALSVSLVASLLGSLGVSPGLPATSTPSSRGPASAG